MRRWLSIGCLSLLWSAGAQAKEATMGEGDIEVYSVEKAAPVKTNAIQRSEAEWRKLLTPDQYRILRQQGTERAFTGQYEFHKEIGVYTCAACGTDLFLSDTKFDSGCGWPSFFQPVGKGNLIAREDRSHGMVRTEIICGRCGSHLGHVFNDGPKPTGLRYCINSLSLNFKPLPAAGKKKE